MSVQIHKQLICDKCGDAFDIDISSVWLRKEAKKAGWKRVGGDDLCPDCFKEEKP